MQITNSNQAKPIKHKSKELRDGYVYAQGCKTKKRDNHENGVSKAKKSCKICCEEV
jgi:hypothetical protein